MSRDEDRITDPSSRRRADAMFGLACPCWPSSSTARSRADYQPIPALDTQDAHNATAGDHGDVRRSGYSSVQKYGGSAVDIPIATFPPPDPSDTASEKGGLLVEGDVPARCKACGQLTSLEQHGLCLNTRCSLAVQQAKPSPKQATSEPVATAPDQKPKKGVHVDQTRTALDKIIAQSCADIAARGSARVATAMQSAPTRPPSTSSDLRAELNNLSLWELLGRAHDSGIQRSKVDAAMEASKPKASVVSLVVEHETAAVPCLEPGARCIDAAKRDDVAGVREALEMGADLQQVGEDGLTALHVAAAKGRLAALRVLIEAITKHSPDSVAVGLDVRSGHSSLGGSIFAGATALFLAARWGNTPEVVELVEAGANVDYCQELQLPEAPSPIHMAATNGHAAVVAVLLQAGADSSRLYYGMTPRQWAVHGGHAAVEHVFSVHGGERA